MPLDVRWPPARLAAVLQMAAPAAVLTAGDLRLDGIAAVLAAWPTLRLKLGKGECRLCFLPEVMYACDCWLVSSMAAECGISMWKLQLP